MVFDISWFLTPEQIGDVGRAYGLQLSRMRRRLRRERIEWLLECPTVSTGVAIDRLSSARPV